MSQPDQPKKAGATFTWVLGAFAGFAVLFILIQAANDSKQGFDPREKERQDNTAEILAAQAKSLASLGLNDPKKKADVFAKSFKDLAAKAEEASTQVVPGSPTQLKQAAAAAPAPAAAPAAPPAAPAPSAAPAPATAPAAPAAPAPAPAAPAPPK
ncbi:hypothetical protein [Prosthecobacter sp.]|uniref:hypothetical protein n=1 Tax=Prosthecobacter sp. TaxID=1965333 RepID=UPI003784AF85